MALTTKTQPAEGAALLLLARHGAATTTTAVVRHGATWCDIMSDRAR